MNNTCSNMQADARKKIDEAVAAISAVQDDSTALEAVNKVDDFTRVFTHCIQKLNALAMSSVETQLTEKATAHIEQFGTDNQRKAAAELYDMPEPVLLSQEYLEHGKEIEPVQNALVNVLSEVSSLDDYIAKKPAIEALINSVPFGRDELYGLVAARLRFLLISEAIDDMVMSEKISYGDRWRYNLWSAFNALDCEDKPFALAFLDSDKLGPRFYHPAALGVNTESIYYCMSAEKVALLAQFTCYEDAAYLIKMLYVSICGLLAAKNGDAGRRLNRLAYAMRETLAAGSLSYWTHPALASNNTDED